MEGTKKLIDSHLLEEMSFFRGVDFGSIRGLLEHCNVRFVSEGEVLIRAGQPNAVLYLILEGSFRVHLQLDLKPVAVLKSGEIVGEMSLITGEPTSAFVVAEGEGRLLVLDESILWSLVDASPLTYNLLLVLARRLYGADRLVERSDELQRELEKFAVTDALTGLYNRRWLSQVLPRLMQRAKMDGQPFSLLLLDIDRFKEYNDTHGHVSGDRLLYLISRAIRDHMRPGEIIARYGGDEFLILLPSTDLATARVVGERVRKLVAQASRGEDAALPPSGVALSIGVAQMGEEDSSEGLIQKADRALYADKGRRNHPD